MQNIILFMFLNFFLIFIFGATYTTNFLEKLKGFIFLEPVLGKSNKDRLKKIITNYSEESIKNETRRENYLRINRFCLEAEEINKKIEEYKIFYELNKKKFKIQDKIIVETELPENSLELKDFFKKTIDYVNVQKKLNEKVNETIELEIILTFLEKYFYENKKEAEKLIEIEKKIKNEIKKGEIFKTLKIEESDCKLENYELLLEYIDLRKNYIEEIHNHRNFFISRQEEDIKNNFEKVENFFLYKKNFSEWKMFYENENPENILKSLKKFLDENKKEAEKLIEIEKKIENEIKKGEIFKTLEIRESDYKPENYELISKYIDLRKNYIEEIHNHRKFFLSRDEENIKNNFEKVEKFFYKETNFDEWKIFSENENPENILNNLKIFLDEKKILKEIFLNEEKIKSEKRKKLLNEIKSYVDKEMLYVNKKRDYENLSSMVIMAFGNNFKFNFDNYYLAEHESEDKKKKN